MSELTLYVGSKNYSSWSLRPWLALAHTGQPFREVVIPLGTPDTAAAVARASPSGKVPLLEDGALRVWDSLAICEYLAERFPAARLWPEARDARAVARSACAEMHAGFVALRTHMGMNIRARHPGRGLEQPGVREDIARIQALWAELRERFGQGGPFLLGHFTNADAFFAPVVTRFVTYGVELSPASRAYAEAVLAHPGMRAWTEAALADPHRHPAYEK